jgi:nicotinate-nucleotide adenylyltransferase
VNAKGLALFGGAFNPPHLTHKKIIAAARAQLPVEGVVILPTGAHPQKQGPKHEMAPPDARLDLCRVAFGDIPYATIDDRELRREGLSYTVDTLRELREENPDTTLFWIIGSDNLPLLDTWRQPDKILELATLVTYPRKGHEEQGPGIRLEVTPDDVSASAIRAELRAGREPSGLDPRVLDRIRHLGLYGT